MLIAYRVSCLILVGPLLTVGVVQGAAADSHSARSGVARFDAAVDKGVAYLKLQDDKIPDRHLTLAAYALLKAGGDHREGLIARGIEKAKGRALVDGYFGYDHVYQCGVDAMLLADSDKEAHLEAIQAIATYVESVQRSDGSWSDAPRNPGDVSMCQYGMLAYWAAMRSGCKVSQQAIEAAAEWLMHSGNADSGWGYRPGTNAGPGKGSSTHNMTVAAAGSLAIGHLLLFGNGKDIHIGGVPDEATAESGRFGGLLQTADEVEEEEDRKEVRSTSRLAASALTARVERAFGWIDSRFEPVSRAEHKIYFYYALERAASLAGRKDNWFEAYGDGLLSMQEADGAFDTHSRRIVGTSFAILYFCRSTQQIINAKQYGIGIQVGGRDVEALFYGKKSKTELGPLDALLKAMEGQDFAKLDVSTEDLVQKIQFGSRDELIGETAKLRVLIKSPDATNRQVAYWALGRTCDFELIPLMLDGLNDPSIDVNVEALSALRFISRKANGLGLTFDPLGELPEGATDEQRVKTANEWRLKAMKAWQTWYAGVRPYRSGDGLDEYSR